MKICFYMAVPLLLVSLSSHALNVLSINAEFSQGQKTAGKTIAAAEVRVPSDSSEIDSYVNMINSTRADIVGLTEPANKRIAEAVAEGLGADWRLVVREDRNAKSGVRVSLISRVKLIQGSVTNLPESYGYSRYEKHRSKPDAVLAAGFELDDKRYFAVITYLTAGKGDYAEVRYAQADAVRNALFDICRDKYDHCLVMGNMNDEPGSHAVKRIQGVDGMFGDKVALKQAEHHSEGPTYTFGSGREGVQVDQIMSTMHGTASLLDVAPRYSGHKSVLLVGRDPTEKEKPSKKIKRDRKKLAEYHKLQHLKGLVEKQRNYIVTLELQREILQQQLAATKQQSIK